MDGTSLDGQADRFVQAENEVTVIDALDSRRTAEQVENLRAALEVRESTGNEAEDLTRLLEHQMAHLVPGDDEQALEAAHSGLAGRLQVAAGKLPGGK